MQSACDVVVIFTQNTFEINFYYVPCADINYFQLHSIPYYKTGSFN